MNQFGRFGMEDEEQHIEEVKQANIESGEGGIQSIDLIKSTEISSNGDVKITEAKSFFIQRGERVSIDSIIGQCIIETCRQWLTGRTFRECVCTKILCPDHSKWDEQEQGYFCIQCYRDLRWRRFWKSLGSVILKILTAPFRRNRQT